MRMTDTRRACATMLGTYVTSHGGTVVSLATATTPSAGYAVERDDDQVVFRHGDDAHNVTQAAEWVASLPYRQGRKPVTHLAAWLDDDGWTHLAVVDVYAFRAHGTSAAQRRHVRRMVGLHNGYVWTVPDAEPRPKPFPVTITQRG